MLYFAIEVLKMSGFGEYLKSSRKKSRMSQRELAKLVGVDFTYISKIENGTMPAPSEETIKKIAAVLGEEADKMILLAKKVPSEIHEVIFQHEELPAFLRKAPSLTKKQWEKINEILADNEGKYNGNE